MTRHVRLLTGWTAAIALAVAVPFGWQAVGTLFADAPQTQRATSIPSLSEPGENLDIRDRSERTGLVSFAATEGRGILVSVQANAPTETRARSFVAQYGAAFGVYTQDQLRLARQPELDAIGMDHARFQQQHNGVPVTAGEFFVHLKGSRVMSANGRVLPIEKMPDTTPAIAETQAIAAARGLIGRNKPNTPGIQYVEPRLEILNRGLLQDGDYPSHLTWFVEAVGGSVREYIWVDAQTGGVVFHFNQAPHARVRQIFDANGTNVLPGTLKRSEGGPATGDAEEDALYAIFGAAYDYFLVQHGRDSFNGGGATIRGSVDWFEAGNCPNSFWNGAQMVFCDGLVADDLAAHEFTHAVTQYTANLFYFTQSGALSDSYSDIFGETIDLTGGIGNDTLAVRWDIGEDSSTGAIRDMMTPSVFGDPSKMTDAGQFVCSASIDAGGVHTNSGIPNHAYALMVDGGTYNGHTITGIGLTKAGKIQYRALSVYLSSGSTFLDNYNAVNQSCTDLIGLFGIIGGDCTQVNEALRAVEMDKKPLCPAQDPQAILCPTGAAPTTTLFVDDFETVPNSNWTMTSNSPQQWEFRTMWGKGDLHAFGPATAFASVHQMTKASAVLIPPQARMHFEHAFFHHAFNNTYYDGGVVEYSTNGGATWASAQSLIDAGQRYNGTLDPVNPLGAVPAFVFDSFGFTNTRLDLGTLAGQSVLFRFRVTNDAVGAYYGWSVDNVRIYTCPGDSGGGNMILNGNFAAGGTPPTPPANWSVFSAGTEMVWNAASGTFNFQRPPGNTQGVIFQQTGVPLPAFTPIYASLTMVNTDPARKRFSVLIHDADFSDLSVCTFWLDPSAPWAVYQMATHTTKPWANATISIYAATVGTGGFYQLDSLAMFRGTIGLGTNEMTQCTDPVHAPAGGSLGAELLMNGGFSGGTIAPWVTFGNIQSALSAGVFQFFKLAGLPAGVVFQATGQAMTDDQKLRATFQLGNSSTFRQRVTVLLHDNDFSDLRACTFFLPPGLALSTYAMRTYTSKAWTDATISFYPGTAGTLATHQWLRLDNVSLTRTGTSTVGTECYEPGDVPIPPGISARDSKGR